MFPATKTYTLTISDDFNIGVNRKCLEKITDNLHECLDSNGMFKTSGVSFFNVETIRPCTIKQKKDMTTVLLDGLFHITGYGGYELGGRGCYYIDLKDK